MLSWLLKVIVATAVLTAVGVFAGAGYAMAAATVSGSDIASQGQALSALIPLLCGRCMGRSEVRRSARLELSPLRRVRAASAVHCARCAAWPATGRSDRASATRGISRIGS